MSTSLEAVLDQFAEFLAVRVAQRLSSDRQAHPQEPKKAPDFLSEADVAKRTGLSRRTLQGWRHRGGGPKWTKLGPRRVVYAVVDLDAFLEPQRANGNGTQGKRATRSLGRRRPESHPT
jgi:predicted DNA-binding transcriptional regulator AlpA